MLDNTINQTAWNARLSERYRLGSLLGSGSAAEVRRAEDTRLHRDVAVKLFPADPDPVTQRRFGAEAQVLAQLQHPGLVSIYDAGIDGHRPFLIMQLVEGQCLRSRIAGQPMSPPAMARVGIAMAEAMDHMHRRGVVHRDVKPSNILVDQEGDPHLADFGIARQAGQDRITGTNELVGTACYLAPEQLTAASVDPPIDVYALGLVLVECLTGELVYPGDDQLSSALSRLDHEPRIPADLPVRLAALLRAMTSTDPARRPTARQCADTLRAWIAHPAGSGRPLLEVSPLPAPSLFDDLADPGDAAVRIPAPAAPADDAVESTAAIDSVDLTADPLAIACRTAGRRTRRMLALLGRATARHRTAR
jgi:serine/threonine protein kinase